MRRSALAVVLALAGGVLGATPALADFSACESGVAAANPRQKIQLYTTCLTKGGVSRTDAAGAFNNRGVAWLSLGETDKAFADFSAAIAYDPNWGNWYVNRARIYVGRGQWAEAQADIDAALKRSPSAIWPEALALRARLNLAKGDHAAAMADIDEAVRRGGRDARSYNAAAWALATAPEAGPEEHARAIELALEAVWRSGGAPFHDTLAAAYASAGRLDQAVAEERQAVSLAQTGKLPADAYERRLQQLQARAAAVGPAPPANPAP